MNLPQLLSAAVDGAGAAAEPLNIPGMDGEEQTGGEGSGGDSATCTRSGDAKGLQPGPPSPRGEPGLQPQGEVLPKVRPCGTRSPIRGLGHRPRAVITGTSAELGGRWKEEQSCAPCTPSLGHIVRLYSMPLLAEMPDQGRRLQRRLWACLYILWGMEHGLRLASVEPMCCR